MTPLLQVRDLVKYYTADGLFGAGAPPVRDAFGQPDPGEERPFRAGAGRCSDAVSTRLVASATRLDRVLRAAQRGDPGLLDRPEDARTQVRRQEVDPRHDLGVPDHEPEPPARHPVRLRHRVELDADLLRARHGEEAVRLAAVEDEVRVRQVVDDHRPGLLGPVDGLVEDTGRRADRAGVRRVVEVQRRRLARKRGEVGRVRIGRVQPGPLDACAGERYAGVVVGVAGIGEHDLAAAVGEHECELRDGRLRAGHDGDLPLRIELDSVERSVALRQRLLQLG